MPDHFGKYRGIVVDNADPLGQARVRVQVPDVLGQEPSAWAVACLPWAASPLLPVVLPAVGAAIWVEFQEGDPAFPIWSGYLWDPSAQPPAGGLILATASGSISITDVDGSVTLASSAGARVVVSSSGIEVDNGRGAHISLNGPTVSINRGALEVS